MTKVVVTVEVNQAEYDKVHGPGTEFWRHIMAKELCGTIEKEQQAKEDYKRTIARMALLMRLWMRSERRFYDWSDKGWLTLTWKGRRFARLVAEWNGISLGVQGIVGAEAIEEIAWQPYWPERRVVGIMLGARMP